MTTTALWFLGWLGITVLVHFSTARMSEEATDLMVDLMVNHAPRLQRFPVASRSRIAYALVWVVDALTAAILTGVVFVAWLVR